MAPFLRAPARLIPASLPAKAPLQARKIGDEVYAGTLNLGSPLVITADATGDNTLLAEMGVLIDKAIRKTWGLCAPGR